MFNKNNYTNNFNQFFIDYQRRFIHFASTYVHDEAVAEDFVIESIMYYWENKERLPSDINIPAYVMRVQGVIDKSLPGNLKKLANEA